MIFRKGKKWMQRISQAKVRSTLADSSYYQVDSSQDSSKLVRTEITKTLDNTIYLIQMMLMQSASLLMNIQTVNQFWQVSMILLTSIVTQTIPSII